MTENLSQRYPDVQSVAFWVVERAAGYLGRAESELDPAVPLADYGLDSVAALSLAGEIEDEFDIMVEPTLAWDFPTAEAIGGYIYEAAVQGAAA